MFVERIPQGSRLVAAAVALALTASACAGSSERDAGRVVSFHRDIQPIFSASCAGCHPTAYPYLDLRPDHAYDQLVGIAPPNAPSYERVVPGKPDLSYLLIHPPDPSRMNLLTGAERMLIVRWIEQGAKDN
jgi:hypothetical protein